MSDEADLRARVLEQLRFTHRLDEAQMRGAALGWGAAIARVNRELERLRASDAQWNENSMHVIECIERVLDGAETGDVYAQPQERDFGPAR